MAKPPISIPLGRGTYLDFGFGGLGDLLTPDLLALLKYLKGEIEKTPGSEANKPIRDALDRWAKLLRDYQNGDATLEDLKNFDPGPLGSAGVWSDYYDDFISGEEDRSGDVDYGGATGEVTGTTTQGPDGEFDTDFGVDVTIRPPDFPPPPKTEDKRTDGGGAAGGGGLMTSGGGDTGTGPGPATESKQTTDGGGGANTGGDDTGGGDTDTSWLPDGYACQISGRDGVVVNGECLPTGGLGGEDTDTTNLPNGAGCSIGGVEGVVIDGQCVIAGKQIVSEDWEYDPEHDYIYVGDCTFIRVDENGNPIGDPEVVDDEDCSNYTVGGNYSGPDNEWDPTREVNVDIFGEGSIVDTTKDNTEPEEKDKDATEPEEKDKEKTEPEEKEKDTGIVDTGVVDVGGGVGGFETGTGTTDTGPATESKQTTGGDGGGEVTPTTGTTGGGGPATESKQTDGGDGDGGDGDGGDGDGGTGPNTEGVITFSNMYGYYNNKDDGGGDGGGGDGDGTGDGDGDGNGNGEDGSMFKDISLGGTTSGSSFNPFQAIPTYTAPTYASINLPQENYMADIDTALNQINNLIARNSSMFKGLI